MSDRAGRLGRQPTAGVDTGSRGGHVAAQRVRCRAGDGERSRGRGRRHLPRPHPHRHLELRRRVGPGGARGGRARRHAARRGGPRTRARGVGPAPRQRRRAHPRGRPVASGSPRARPPRRRAGARRRLAGRSLLGRGRRRLRLGPGRRRHEGHGRHDPGDRPRPRSLRRAAAPGPRRRVPGGRRGGRSLRRHLDRRPPPRPDRGRHRGGKRGRRLLDDDRRPTRLPSPDGREGSGLAAAGGARPRRARVTGQLRQRRHPALRGRRAGRRTPVAARDHPDGPGLPRRGRADHRRPARPRRPRRARRHAGHDGQLRGRHPAEHLQPHPARGRIQAQRHPRHRVRAGRLPLPPRQRTAADRDGPRAGRARGSTSRRCTAASRWRCRSRATSSMPWSPPWPPRTARPPCCPTACRAVPTTRTSARPGVVGYGFAPLRLPAELDFAGMFHGVDERVPVDALRFGVRTLGRFLRTC